MRAPGTITGEDFAAPESVVELLNKSVRQQALLGADYRLQMCILNAASLVGHGGQDTWKAIQALARAFALTAKKSSCETTHLGQRVRGLFRSITFTIDDEKLWLAQHWTI